MYELKELPKVSFARVCAFYKQTHRKEGAQFGKKPGNCIQWTKFENWFSISQSIANVSTK